MGRVGHQGVVRWVGGNRSFSTPCIVANYMWSSLTLFSECGAALSRCRAAPVMLWLALFAVGVRCLFCFSPVVEHVADVWLTYEAGTREGEIR